MSSNTTGAGWPDMFWIARVEWRESEPDEARTDEILNKLDGFSAVIASPRAGLLEAYVSIARTSTLRQAITEALGAVESATGVKAIGVEVLFDSIFDERAAQPLIPPLVALSDIARLAGVTRQRASEIVQRDGFPPAVTRVSSGGDLRVKAHVESWLSAWDRKPGRVAKAGSASE